MKVFHFVIFFIIFEYEIYYLYLFEYLKVPFQQEYHSLLYLVYLLSLLLFVEVFFEELPVVIEFSDLVVLIPLIIISLFLIFK